MTRIYIQPLLGTMTVAILLAACGVKDPIFNTPHPDHGTVTLTTDWSGIGEGLNAPDAYTVAATPDGSATADYTATLSGVTNRLDHLFEPGTYRFLVHNTAEHITLSGTTATVAQVPVTPADAATTASGANPADNTGQLISNAPGWLFTSVMDNIAITQDAEHTLTAPIQQQVRQLTLIIEPTGGRADKIESITGTLSGVAGTLDTDSGTHGSPSCAALTFTKITTGTDAGKWSATVRLLGIAGEQQQLTVSITFAGGIPKHFTLNSDLTTQLAAFNADKRSPATIKLNVKVPSTDGTVTLTTDWSNIGTGLTVPESYTVETTGYSATLTGVTNRLDHLFAPGNYHFFVYNQPEHIIISGSVVSVATAPASAEQTGAFIHGNPGWLFACTLDKTIEKDQEYELTAVMQQHVRQLTLVIELVGDASERAESITAALFGVAGTFDYSYNMYGMPSTVPLVFTRISTGDDAGKWSATVRLLGLVDSMQWLEGTIVFTGGNPAQMKFDSDLSAQLIGFNKDKRTPFFLNGVVETPAEADSKATISDWIPGGNIYSEMQWQ